MYEKFVCLKEETQFTNYKYKNNKHFFLQNPYNN